MKQFYVYDTQKKGWLRWGFPNNTPEIPLMLVETKGAASTFSEYDVERLKESAKEAGKPEDYWKIEEVGL